MAITYTLRHPVTVGEFTCKEIVLQRPKMKDFIAVGRRSTDTAAATAALLPSLSGTPETVIAQFDVEDCARLRYLIQRIWAAHFLFTEEYTGQTLEEIEAEEKVKAEADPLSGTARSE
jgi:hypothetical protein